MTNRPQTLTTSLAGRARRLLIALMSVLALLVGSSAGAQSLVPTDQSFSHLVLVAGSDNAAFNIRFIELLKQTLGDRIEVRPYTEAISQAQPQALVVSLGNRALSRVQQQSTRPPTLALMIDEDQFANYANRNGPPLSAIYYDPPLLRQALLGHLILPHGNQVSMLVRPGQETNYDQLIDELASYGLKAKLFTVDSEDNLIASLARALTYGDYLLAVSDNAIYNPRTIKHILLTAYRRNRIVIGPGRAFVRAGVLATTYTPVDDIARAASRHIKAFLQSGRLPPAVHPEDFGVEINQQVARSLNIPLPEASQLEAQLKSLLGAGTEEEAP
ncbi:ABC transporter substrate-binding protein [Marinobacter sp. SS21]|uniref:ABC transporter substrate-binding protein n=1 Tax=Marinobacter sp. SS21 TaxID=2979460 RepID=UPI00232D0EFD|nr:ABC transporter substrate-binding protein [Marinobacter sp. SS21]MDC0663390.1 ABC transporter substrate-binding protein [Marinobacter sp. SS21]